MSTARRRTETQRPRVPPALRVEFLGCGGSALVAVIVQAQRTRVGVFKVKTTRANMRAGWRWASVARRQQSAFVSRGVTGLRLTWCTEVRRRKPAKNNGRDRKSKDGGARRPSRDRCRCICAERGDVGHTISRNLVPLPHRPWPSSTCRPVEARYDLCDHRRR